MSITQSAPSGKDKIDEKPKPEPKPPKKDDYELPEPNTGSQPPSGETTHPGPGSQTTRP